jgi:hypothetical protein
VEAGNESGIGQSTVQGKKKQKQKTNNPIKHWRIGCYTPKLLVKVN